MRRVVWASVLVLSAFGATACSRDPEAAKRNFVATGDRYLAEKKYPEAILEYRNAVQRDAKFGEAHLKLTDAYLASGDVRNALGESVRAADALPDRVDAQLRAGTLLLAARQYPEAKARALAALAKDPKNSEALILLGNSMAGLKDLDGAIQQIQKVIDENPQLTLSYSNLADLYVAKGDKAAAERAFVSAVQNAPKSADAHVGFANFLWSQGRLEEAERQLKAAVSVDPKSAMANRALATLYMAQDRLADTGPYLEAYAKIVGTMDAQLLLADYYVSVKNIAAARQRLNDIAKDKNWESRATVRLAMLDYREGRKSEAYQRLDGLLKKDAKEESALEQKARFLLLESRTQEALAVTSSLMTIDPDSIDNKYLRAATLEMSGSFDDALPIYLDVLKADPTSPSVKQSLAAIYLRKRQPVDALGYAAELVKAQPQSVQAHLLYAQGLLQTGDIARAESELIALSKAAPTSAEVSVWLGILYEAKHDTVRARQSYQRAFDLQPTAIAALSGLTSVDLSEKKQEAAISRIEAQIAQHPGDANLLLLHALTLTTIGDLTNAERAYQKVIEVSPGNIEAYSRLGAIYLTQNRLDDARARYEEIVKRDPKSAAAETMLGTILVNQGRNADARKHFERALEIDSHNAVAANNLAWDYANNGGNLDLALQLAQTSKAALPDSASVTDTLGWVYYKKGLSSLAVSTFRQAALQDSSNANANIRYHLANALIQQGDRKEARKVLEDALRLNPKFADADEARRLLASLAGS
jgi:tetratricopeptide (TPR) repeat protein